LLVGLLDMAMIAVLMGTPKIAEPPSSKLCEDIGGFTQTVSNIRAGALSKEQAIGRLGEAQNA
jgi:hypothetical protein